MTGRQRSTSESGDPESVAGSRAGANLSRSTWSKKSTSSASWSDPKASTSSGLTESSSVVRARQTGPSRSIRSFLTRPASPNICSAGVGAAVVAESPLGCDSEPLRASRARRLLKANQTTPTASKAPIKATSQ